jgi:hypothetical protein
MLQTGTMLLSVQHALVWICHSPLIAADLVGFTFGNIFRKVLRPTGASISKIYLARERMKNRDTLMVTDQKTIYPLCSMAFLYCQCLKQRKKQITASSRRFENSAAVCDVYRRKHLTFAYSTQALIMVKQAVERIYWPSWTRITYYAPIPLKNSLLITSYFSVDRKQSGK